MQGLMLITIRKISNLNSELFSVWMWSTQTKQFYSLSIGISCSVKHHLVCFAIELISFSCGVHDMYVQCAALRAFTFFFKTQFYRLDPRPTGSLLFCFCNSSHNADPQKKCKKYKGVMCKAIIVMNNTLLFNLNLFNFYLFFNLILGLFQKKT